MKARAFAMVFIFIACFMHTQAFAGTYFDDMDDLESNSIRQNFGFKAYIYPRGQELYMQDRSVFVFENAGSTSGWVKYRVNGASEVTACIYSQQGTFVSKHPESPGQYVMGIIGNHIYPAVTPALKQALFSKAAKAVYTGEGGLKQLYYSDETYIFGPVITPPAGEMIGYGVNIYYSQNGESFTRAETRLSKIGYEPEVQVCVEEYVANVPETALYVMVEINDIVSVPLVGGGVADKLPQALTSIASVSIYGDNLILGEQSLPTVESSASSGEADGEPGGGASGDATENYDWLIEFLDRLDERERAESEAESTAASSSRRASNYGSDSDSSEGSSRSSSASPTSSKASEESREPESEPEPKSSSSTSERAASSKFEGVISASPSSQQPELSETAPLSEPVQQITSKAADNKTEIYEIPRESKSDSRFNSGVTGYIIVVTGAIVAAAVLPKKK